MEKIKVSKDIDNAIKLYLKYKNEESMLKERAKGDGFIGKDFKILNELSVLDLANVLINGYEIELTNEEKLLKLYKQYSTCEMIDEETDVVLKVLKLLKVEIKGINT